MPEKELSTADGKLRLIRPDVARDAPLSVGWLQGEAGRRTQLLMGNAPQRLIIPTLATEQERVRSFLENKQQRTWAIEYDGQVVGAIWVNLQSDEHLKAPAIHIMIGDPEARGKGIGKQAIGLVMRSMRSEKEFRTLYSRHLVDNTAAAAILRPYGFQKAGKPYGDADGLQWQNEVADLT